MQEMNVPISTVIAGGLWSMTIVVVLAAWAVFPFSHDLALMIVTCAGIMGLAAGTATIRSYMVRLARLVRLSSSGVPPSSGAGSIHSVHK